MKKNTINKWCSIALTGMMLFCGSIGFTSCGDLDNASINEGITMKNIQVQLERSRLFSGFDTEGEVCKDGGDIWTDGKNLWLSWGMTKLTDSDVAGDYQISSSSDGGKTFSEPATHSPYSYLENDINYTYGGCTSCYSKKYDVSFSVGLMCQTTVGSSSASFVREPAYLLRDSQTQAYSNEKPKKLPFPFDSPSVAPHGQPIEFENGDFLLTFYYTEQGNHEKYKSVAIIYSFDGTDLKIKEVGTPISDASLGRGIYEPSIAKLDDIYYITLRTDEKAMLAWSSDGLHYSEPVDFTWEDGTKIGSANTQQRWIRHQDVLFLVYTRTGANNDHVMRNRAPLFMARFDESRKCLIKETEMTLVPELGASLATMIGVCEISENISYIVATECMQSPTPPHNLWWEVSKYGADNSVWVVKITSICFG